MLEFYILTWLTSFVNESNGPIFDYEKVYDLFQVQGLLACLVCFLSIPFVGKLCDRHCIKYTLPFSFVIRGLMFFSAYRMRDPTNFGFYVCMPLMHLSYFIVVLANGAFM